MTRLIRTCEHRCREQVSRELEDRTRSLAEEDAIEKAETMRQMIKAAREQEEAARQLAFTLSKREAQLYAAHKEEVRQRQQKAVRMGNDDVMRLRQHEESLRQAKLRQQAKLREREQQQMERRMHFEARRQAMLSRLAAEEVKQAEHMKELRAKEKEYQRAMHALETRKQAEREARIRAAETKMNASTSSFKSAMANEEEALRKRMSREAADLATRISLAQEERAQSARAHSSRHAEVLARGRDEKLAHDRARAKTFREQSITKQRRLDSITQARQQQQQLLQEQLRAEFATKSQLEKLAWKHEMLKSPTSVVRSDISGVKGI
jgi:hypothetical protein